MGSVTNQSMGEQNRRAYNALAEAYSRTWAGNPDVQLADLFLGMLSRNARILDVGCGPGQYSSYFMDEGYSVEAIDTSSKMLLLARNRDPRILFRNLDMTNLDYPDHKFDGLWVCSSLVHIPKESVLPVLIGFRRILKNNGYMLVNAIVGPLDHRIETSEEMGLGYQVQGRFFQWYPSSGVFENILNQAGFEITKIQIRTLTSGVLEQATCRTNTWYNYICRKQTSSLNLKLT